MADSDVYVNFPTGHRVKRSQLQKSQFFDSILACCQQTTNLPLPEGLEREAAISYLDYCVAQQSDYQNMLTCLISCSLLDDDGYLQYCVKRFLLNYSNYKPMLSQLHPLLLEQVYLLMPKDLLPAELQASDIFIYKWLNQHFLLDCESFTAVNNDGNNNNNNSNNNRKQTIHLQVDDCIYSYSATRHFPIDASNVSQIFDISYEINTPGLKTTVSTITDANKGYHTDTFTELRWDNAARRRLKEECFDVTGVVRGSKLCKTWYSHGILKEVSRRSQGPDCNRVIESFDNKGFPTEYISLLNGRLFGLTTRWFKDSHQIESHTYYGYVGAALPTVQYFTKFYLSGRVMMVDDKVAGVCYYYLHSSYEGSDIHNNNNSYGAVNQPLYRIAIDNLTVSQQNRNLTEIVYYDGLVGHSCDSNNSDSNGDSNKQVSNRQQKVKSIRYYNNSNHFDKIIHTTGFSELNAVTIPLQLPDIPKYYWVGSSHKLT